MICRCILCGTPSDEDSPFPPNPDATIIFVCWPCMEKLEELEEEDD